MDSDKISCPICGKEYATSVIESHASKCLFLNESIKEETITLSKDSSPVIRKNKIKPASVKKINPAVKRKNSLEQSQNFEENEENDKNVLSQKSVIISLFNNIELNI